MSLNKPLDLSIIIPVYNEVQNVEALYQEIVEKLAEECFHYEIIFVDDGSSDGTERCLQSLAQQDSRLRPVYHKRNFGQSAALLSGAKAARYSSLVTLDGDGQNDPADIPRLAELYQSENHVILGNRITRNDNGLRRISSRIGNHVRQRLLKDDCPDTGCSLKLFSKEAFLALPHFNHYHRFIPALFKRAGYQLINVSVNHRPRLHGISKYGVMNRLFVGIYDLIGVRWLLNRPCSPEIVRHEH